VTGSPSSTQDKNLRIAITGSLVVHALLFMLLAWMFAGDAAERLWKQTAAPPKEKSVTMIFPQQLMAAEDERKAREKEKEKEPEKPKEEPKKKEIPPPPPLKPDQYLRTTQNQTAKEAPKKPAFISDRDTTASTKTAPFPDASAAETLPTTGGMKTVALEMVDREYRKGDVREDTAPPAPMSNAEPVQARPLPAAPPTILKPKDSPPSPQEQQLRRLPTIVGRDRGRSGARGRRTPPATGAKVNGDQIGDRPRRAPPGCGDKRLARAIGLGRSARSPGLFRPLPFCGPA